MKFHTSFREYNKDAEHLLDMIVTAKKWIILTRALRNDNKKKR